VDDRDIALERARARSPAAVVPGNGPVAPAGIGAGGAR